MSWFVKEKYCLAVKYCLAEKYCLVVKYCLAEKYCLVVKYCLAMLSKGQLALKVMYLCLVKLSPVPAG